MQPKVRLAVRGNKSRQTQGSRILNAEEARLLLGVGRNTLYLWCAEGLIPHKRVGGTIDEATGELHGGRLLFSERLLLGWIENRDNEI
ncbi:helix-turn-helix domain-containing protein [Chloroflexota bacterium]